MINCRRILNVYMLIAHKTFFFFFFLIPNMGMAEDEGWEKVAEIGRENGRLIQGSNLNFYLICACRYKYINIIWFCSNWLAMSNSCYNPFIYGILNVSL